jgi:hypothetical protein
MSDHPVRVSKGFWEEQQKRYWENYEKLMKLSTKELEEILKEKGELSYRRSLCSLILQIKKF